MSIPPRNGKTVLVTGANGYMAANICLQLMRKGYNVRGTSRSTSAKDALLQGPLKGFEDRYQHVLVPDMTVKGAFDEAVEGVVGILHTASPLDFSLQTLDEFVLPAVNGNLSILNSALNCAGPQLASFVLTSSMASVASQNRPGDYAYTEADWNDTSEPAVRKEFSAALAYQVSKVNAERALWDFGEKSKPAFALTALLPGVMTGPPVLFPPTPDKLAHTVALVWKIYSGEAKTVPPNIGLQNHIDIRDIAMMHIWCMEHPSIAGGQRYIMTNGRGTQQATADILRKAYPDREIVVGTPESDYIPGTYDHVPGMRSGRATKALKALGVDNFIGYNQSILDTAKVLEEHYPGVAKNFKK